MRRRPGIIQHTLGAIAAEAEEVGEVTCVIENFIAKCSIQEH